MSRVKPIAPLWRLRSYRFILLGQLVSEFGAALGTLANSWLIYQTTGSQAAVGGMWLLYFLPSLAMQLVAGPYLDRFDKKRIMVFSQWMRSGVFCFSFLVILIQPGLLWPLYLTSLINGLIQPLYVPASQSLLPSLVKGEHLVQANAYLDSALRIAMIAGPPLGGLLVAAVGGVPVLAMVAAGYALSGGLLLMCQNISLETRAVTQSWFAMFREGLAVFYEKPLLLWLSVFSALVQFAVGITLVLNLPFIAGELHGSSFHVGIFLAGYPLGYLLGSLVVARLSFTERFGQHMIMLGSLVLGGATFIALGFTYSLWLAIGIEVFAGLVAPFFHVHNTSLYQRYVPPHLMGRVFSVRLLIVRTTMPLGVWIGGQLGDQVGIRPLFMAMGALIVVASVIGLFFQKFTKKSSWRIFDEGTKPF
ncbi:MFS transporter [Brevibacillus sp. NRS-1366]|uniref:MFS transporter n=1 Tax=Brevibacillus sp. NRS-1366 TaxID=3233899 RepID=UPI003D1BA3DC